MKDETLKTVGNIALIGAGTVISVLGIKEFIKNYPEIANKTGRFFGNVIGGIAEVISVGSKSINAVYVHNVNTKSSYWVNSDASVLVKINRYFPSSGEIIYTKYNKKTMRPIKVCKNYYSNFLNHYWKL